MARSLIADQSVCSHNPTIKWPSEWVWVTSLYFLSFWQNELRLRFDGTRARAFQSFSASLWSLNLSNWWQHYSGASYFATCELRIYDQAFSRWLVVSLLSRSAIGRLQICCCLLSCPGYTPHGYTGPYTLLFWRSLVELLVEKRIIIWNPAEELTLFPAKAIYWTLEL